MNWKYIVIGMITFIFCFQGCGAIQKKKDPIEAEIEKNALEKAQYQPFKERNTIEGYAEFIESNPGSHMVHIARQQMDDLRYAPYEKQNTIAGYSEFISKYPENGNVAAARRGIETLAFQDVEKKGAMEGYSEFLTRYPNSHFDCEAKDRLQELKFRQLHEQLEACCRFDLLLYRLTLKRRQNELNMEGKSDLADFKCSASLADLKGTPYFNTQLIYSNERIPEKILSGQAAGELFDNLLSEALTYLFSKFRGKSKISGFGFEVAASPFNFCKEQKRVVQYYFPLDAVDRFTRGAMNKEELLTIAIAAPN
jgi:hypothetical protein